MVSIKEKKRNKNINSLKKGPSHCLLLPTFTPILFFLVSPATKLHSFVENVTTTSCLAVKNFIYNCYVLIV